MEHNFLIQCYVFIYSKQNITVKIEEPVPVRNGNNKVLTPVVDNVDLDSNIDRSEDADSDGAGPKKKWIRKPLNKKAKRLRQNRRLRKLLIPKNALMSLHELMGNSISEYRVMPEERGFVAQVLVNNIQYEGRGEFISCIFIMLPHISNVS